MANGNPFYVQPAIASESVQRGLSSLGSALGSRIAADRQAEQQAALTEQAKGLIESGDLDAISQFMVANPQYAEGLKGAMQFKNEQTKKNYVDSAYRILRGEDPSEVIRDRAAFVSRQGGSPAETLSALELSPEEIKENARLELSVLDPQGFKSFQEAVKGISGTTIIDGPSDIQVAEWYRTATPEQKAAFDQTKRGSKDPIEKQIEDAEKLAAVRVKEAQTISERKQGVSDLGSITKSAKESRKQINTINRLEKLNKKAFAGAGSEAALAIAKIGDQLGINIDGLSESEQFQAIGNTLVLDKSQQMSGALSNADMEFLRNTVPNLNNTKEGRSQMLDFAKKMQQREIDYSRAAQKFRKENGYFNQAEFDAEYQRFADENSLFEGEVPAEQEASKPVMQYNEGQTATNPATGQRMIYRGGQWQTL